MEFNGKIFNAKTLIIIFHTETEKYRLQWNKLSNIELYLDTWGSIFTKDNNNARPV